MELAIQVRGTWEFLLSTVRWAEGAGMVAFGLPDHYLRRGTESDAPAWDSLTHIAGLTRETDLELVSLVSPVTFRHPAVYYKIGVTLDEMSDGRFTLGLGAGWMDEEFEVFGLPYPEMSERIEMLEEAMAYLRAAVTPGSQPYQGKHFQLADFDPHPRPKNLRLMAGGAGKAKARRITALYADEYNLYVCPPDEFREIRSRTRDLAESNGRNADEIFWSSAGPALAARKESDYRALLEKFAAQAGVTTDRIEEMYDKRSIPHGSGTRASEGMAALAEAGCERYYLQAFAADVEDLDMIADAYRI